MKLLFFDFDPAVINDMERVLSKICFNTELLEKRSVNPQFQYACIDVRKLAADVYVSPANSHGYMDGGIDKIYSKMFKDIGKIVRAKIKWIGIKNRRKQYVLPVSSATVVKINDTAQLICAPTMTLPGSIIDETRNVYYAMYAILEVSREFPADTVIAVPGLGTGVGGLTGEECALQIAEAIDDYSHGSPKYPEDYTTNYAACDYYTTNVRV